MKSLRHEKQLAVREIITRCAEEDSEIGGRSTDDTLIEIIKAALTWEFPDATFILPSEAQSLRTGPYDGTFGRGIV